MKNLHELFVHHLQDLYSAECQILDALPKMANKATDKKLQEAFEIHLEETKDQQERLVTISKQLDFTFKGETCKAMEGLIKEAKDFMDEDESEDIMNAGLVAEAQRIEHYEISGYGTAVRYAKELGYNYVAQILKTTLDEEYETDKWLDHLAKSGLNKEAIQTSL